MTLAPRVDRAIRLGAIAWIASAQFFITQAVVQSAWTTPYSLSANYISDLGNTVCAPYPSGSANYVCSPWHALMNVAFLLVGITTIAGALSLRRALGAARLWPLGLALVAIAGAGFILVGLFPENVSLPPHKTGATLQFVCGNLGLAIVGAELIMARKAPRLGMFTLATGAIGLLATALFGTGHMLGLGVGGMERFAAYPLPAGCVALGCWLASPAASRARR